MPGVPSSRGCDGCRAVKKKCDQAAPACSRCARLRVVCVGSGQRRYKFHNHQPLRHDLIRGRSGQELPSREDLSAAVTIFRVPGNERTSLAGALVDTLKPSVDLRYNLAWTYGFILDEVPARLGKNGALDAAARALTTAHSNFCLRRPATNEVLTRYSRALQELAVCLDDTVTARSSETLCAVYLLQICEGLVGTTHANWTGHGEGAAQLLKLRRYYNEHDDFETKLLLSLRGPVLFEALFNPKIHFTASEWDILVRNHFDGDTFEGKLMRCLCRVPDYLQRQKAVRKTGIEDPQLPDESRANYQAVMEIMTSTRESYASVQELLPDGIAQSLTLVQTHAYLQRLYGFSLAVSMIFNFIVRAIHPGDDELRAESVELSKETVSLAERAHIYRPLGASYILLCLYAALLINDDLSLRTSIEQALTEYLQDYPTDFRESAATKTERLLRDLREHFR